MNIFYALLLGIIEGLTEFIPVSSTAHMLIVQKLLNIPSKRRDVCLFDSGPDWPAGRADRLFLERFVGFGQSLFCDAVLHAGK